MDKNKKLFPQRLWDLVHDGRYHHFIRWSDDGQRVYLNRNEFEQCYLRTPNNQFHTQKAISFVRQMNMYGFKKVDDSHYENDNFKRGCHHLIRHMVRRNANRSPAHQGGAAAAATNAAAAAAAAAAQAATERATQSASAESSSAAAAAAAVMVAAAAAAANSAPASSASFPLSLALSDGQSLTSIVSQRDLSAHTTHNHSGRSSASTMSSGCTMSAAVAAAAAAAAHASAAGGATTNPTTNTAANSIAQHTGGLPMTGHLHEALVQVPACRAASSLGSLSTLGNFGASQQCATTTSLLGALDTRAQSTNLGSLYEQLMFWSQLFAFRRATE